MPKHWKNLMFRTTVWIVAEILLNVIGIDDLADYSEFVFEGRLMEAATPARVIQVTSV
jgi:hypothetical protein